ncbi:hypothetical protein [Pedobacter nototheniae]|uniref:hypothetical protein n=1 Tax=Pedobacter nototheniae TaxID=2488994 RepID=UPI00292E7A5C|nr:hypothetical protein [Pedobacter nototheniae]
MKKVNNFVLYDWKTISQITCFFLLLVSVLFVAFNISYLAMLWQGIQKTAETSGEIYERKEVLTTTQTIGKGNITRLNKIQFKYSFIVNGIVHVDSCFLGHSFINSSVLTHLQTYKLPISVKIRYNPSRVNESVLWLP